MNQEKICVFQVIDMETGVRSEPCTETPEGFAKKLEDFLPIEKRENTGVIVLMDQNTGVMEFSRAPFFTAKTFMESFNHG